MFPARASAGSVAIRRAPPATSRASTACRRAATPLCLWRRLSSAPADRAGAARTRRAPVPHRCARDPGRRSPPGGPAAGWHRRSPAPPVARRVRAGRTPRKTATPAPRGEPPTHTSCKTPGESGSGAVRAPPPKVGWASTTCTFRPARAQMTAAVSPLGPLPTTVTSTGQLQPIGWPGESACCTDCRQTRRINRRRAGRPGRGALGRRARPREAAGRRAGGRRAAGAVGHHRRRRGAGGRAQAQDRRPCRGRAWTTSTSTPPPSAVCWWSTPRRRTSTAPPNTRWRCCWRRPAQIPAADASLREHAWKRSSFSGTEIFGKTVGVVGLGRIGQLVAQRLERLRHPRRRLRPLRVAGAGRTARYRTAAPRRPAGPRRLHLGASAENARDGGPDRQGGAGEDQAGRHHRQRRPWRPGRRGGAGRSGEQRSRSRRAGLDVFATEPCTDSPLFELPQVVVTPHLGASTDEAQDRAGTDVAESVKLALAGEFVPDAVNVGGGVVNEEVAPWLDLVRKLGLLAATLSEGPPVSLSVQVRGELASEDVGVLEAFGSARAVLGGRRGSGDVRQRAGAGRRTRRHRRDHHGLGKSQPPQCRRRACGGRRRLGRQRRRRAVRAAAGAKRSCRSTAATSTCAPRAPTW